MEPATVGILVAVGVVVLLAVIVGLWLWSAARSLAARRARVDHAWSDVATSTTRRGELVPGLVEAVRGHAPHETVPLDRLTRARAAADAAVAPTEASEAEAEVQTALKAVFGAADSYPQLLASQDFLRLQSELVASEDAIQAARRAYNGSVREYNAAASRFPARGFARRAGDARRDFFEVAQPSAIAEPPRVQF